MTSLTELPYDIFLCIARHLDVLDFVQLTWTCRTLHEQSDSLAAWSALAERMLEIRPLPVPALRTLMSLNLAELRHATITAARLELNFSKMLHGSNVHCAAQLRGSQRFDLELGDLRTLMIVRGRFALTSEASGDGRLACWDIQNGRLMASYAAGREADVIQCRPVDHGHSVMFILSCGSPWNVTADTDTLCLLLRLRFSEDVAGDIVASFSPEFKFHSPSLELYDMSLSEEVICTVCVDQSRHFVLSVLDWRRRTVASRVTTVQLHADGNWISFPVLGLLGPDHMSIVIDHGERPLLHTFPHSILLEHTDCHSREDGIISLDSQHLFGTPAEPAASLTRPVEANSEEFHGWPTATIITNRLWTQTLQQPRYNPRQPVSEWRVYSFQEPGRGQSVLAHHAIPVVYDDRATMQRTFVAPLLLAQAHTGEEEHDTNNSVRLIVGQAKYALWIEVLGRRPRPQQHQNNTTPDSPRSQQILALRLCAMPSDELRALKESPRWYASKLVRTLPTPEGLDLGTVTDLALDEAHGIVLLSTMQGFLWVLRF